MGIFDMSHATKKRLHLNPGLRELPGYLKRGSLETRASVSPGTRGAGSRLERGSIVTRSDEPTVESHDERQLRMEAAKEHVLHQHEKRLQMRMGRRYERYHTDPEFRKRLGGHVEDDDISE